jgi:sucrose phosphorylase
VRLDAIPYLWKEPGTSCAHLPQTHALIKVIRDVYDAAAPHVLLLTETNVPHRENVAYFGDRGDEAQMIYNFSLAPLILWSLARGDAAALTDWARGVRRIGPKATYLNITATHDGIGMRPTEGLLDEPARAALVQRARDHGGDVTGKRNADGTLSPYELNINYFDAVNDPRAVEPPAVPVRRFLVSQAIPLAFLGLPGLYIHSLFGSRNDYDGVRRTGRARSINRAQLDSAALERELAAPASLRAQVFGGIARLLTARQAEPAFHPDAEQEVLAAGTPVFALRRWPAAGAPVLALHNVSGQATEVTVPGFAGGRDIVSGARVPGGALRLAPYDVLWVREGDGASRDASVSGQNRRLN